MRAEKAKGAATRGSGTEWAKSTDGSPCPAHDGHMNRDGKGRAQDECVAYAKTLRAYMDMFKRFAPML